ncbi:class I SAM-dependent methyltransferase [Chitinophaga silvisoli]|uniref:Class I SAM-dependent methyltransferase n=2 Tax=Chitinophaga silvisoli TaxID=2291814 RepID=A0A3E1NN17_9BACT|nr:class I SAM-dependent methyltransferase [Chitinophaga silvisoli]
MFMSDSRFNTQMFTSDDSFDQIYPQGMQQLSKRHWTPLQIATASAAFLAHKPGTRILDIGSGVGKFCLIGAHFHPDSYFYGIEQRKELYLYARNAKEVLKMDNADFICGNFTRFNAGQYDSFYFYNSFFEHLKPEDGIDQQIDYSPDLYDYYTCYLQDIMDQRVSGTRFVTYYSMGDEVPDSYQLVDASDDMLLKMWIKR